MISILHKFHFSNYMYLCLKIHINILKFYSLQRIKTAIFIAISELNENYREKLCIRYYMYMHILAGKLARSTLFHSNAKSF